MLAFAERSQHAALCRGMAEKEKATPSRLISEKISRDYYILIAASTFEHRRDNDLPQVKEVQNDNLGQIIIYLVTLEALVLLIQFVTTIILQNVLWGLLSFLPFVATIGGFEYTYQKKYPAQQKSACRKNRQHKG